MASFAVVVVFPEPWIPTSSIIVGLSGCKVKGYAFSPKKLDSSSWIIERTLFLRERPSGNSFSKDFLSTSLTTLAAKSNWTSASSNALNISFFNSWIVFLSGGPPLIIFVIALLRAVPSLFNINYQKQKKKRD